MFSKARRFDDKPVGCGADAAYNPKDASKAIGGVIPKVDRFADFKQSHSLNSDAESVHSEKSQVFRTPKAVRRLAACASLKRSDSNGSNLKLDEFLEAKNVEIRNKDETIKDYESQIKDMADRIYSLEMELKGSNVKNENNLNIKNDTSESDEDIVSLNNKLVLLKNEYDNLFYVKLNLEKDLNDCKKLLIQYDSLIDERSEIEAFLSEFDFSGDDRILFIRRLFESKTSEIIELTSSLSQSEIEVEALLKTVHFKDEEIQNFKCNVLDLEEKNEELNAIDEKRSLDILAMSDLINANKLLCEELNAKLDEKNEQIKELMEDLALVKGQHALALEANESIRHEYKMEIDSLRTKHGEELLFLEKRHDRTLKENSSKCTESIIEMREKHYLSVKNMEEKFMDQINHLEEVASENIRISEIQYEERYAELQRYTDRQLQNEKQNKLNELQMCQEIAEREINNCTREINKLKTELQFKDNELITLSKHIEEYQSANNSKEEELDKLQSKHREDSENFLAEIRNLQSDKQICKAEVDKLNRENNMLSITLNSTRQSVDVLGSRLRRSEEDSVTYKNNLDTSENLNSQLKEEIVDLQIESSNSKEEYTQLLTSIAQSKSIMDKNHADIMKEREDLLKELEMIKSDRIKEIDDLKSEQNNRIGEFKTQCMILLERAQNKADYLKKECDEAYKKIEDCQNLLLATESHLESKDQELNELEQENNRISGTLAASEQEKSELQALLNAFDRLAKDKDVKIHDCLKCIRTKDEEIYSAEERMKKLTEFLEATDFIVKEKDLSLSKYEEDILKLTSENVIIRDNHTKDLSALKKLKSEYENYIDKFNNMQLDNEKSKNQVQYYDALLEQMKTDLNVKDMMINTLDEKIKDLKTHLSDCKEEFLQIQCDNLQKELDELSEKYANLVGHQNVKQKIKHIIDLKSQNSFLKEENEKLSFTIQKQTTLIEKLRKDIGDVHTKSPLMQKKQYLFATTPHGKENLVKPLSPSPNRLGSPKTERALTPLKDSNR